MLGVNKGEVKLVAHSNNWEEYYTKEAVLLYSLIGEHVVDIQHIGSTAIPGIIAKPIIDILIGVKNLNDVERFDKNKLKQEGYYYLPRVTVEGKQVFAKFSNLDNLTKTHILHVVEYKGDWWKQHIFFRDYLIEHEGARKEYETLKRHLAQSYLNDERLYTDGKKKFVDHILSKR